MDEFKITFTEPSQAINMLNLITAGNEICNVPDPDGYVGQLQHIVDLLVSRAKRAVKEVAKETPKEPKQNGFQPRAISDVHMHV